VLERHNRDARSSTRISAIRILADPPSLDSGEITDKASINQRMILKNRARLVDELYREPPAPGVIRL
jgi:feruloyl-CoA synthase